MLRTIIAAVLVTLLVILAGPVLLLYTWISSNPKLLYKIGVGGCYAIARAVGVRDRVERCERVPPGTVLFLANHTSFVDAVPIVHALPRRVAILAKKSLFELPIVGWAFKLAGFVPVDRSDRESAIASVEVAAQHLRRGTSFLAYPEGTRSYDGRLLPFKKGIFVMAIRAGATIVPMVAIGAHRVLPKKSLRIVPGEVVVRFGEPISAAQYSVEQREDLSRRVREAMAALLPPDQQPHEPAAGSVNSRVIQ